MLQLLSPCLLCSIKKTASWETGSNQLPSAALANVCTDIVSQEISARHVTPTTKVGKQAHTRGRHPFKSGTRSTGYTEKDIVAALEMFMAAVLASALVLPFQVISRCRCFAEDPEDGDY